MFFTTWRHHPPQSQFYSSVEYLGVYMVSIATKAHDHVADRGMYLDAIVQTSKSFANMGKKSKFKVERVLGNVHCSCPIMKLKY